MKDGVLLWSAILVMAVVGFGQQDTVHGNNKINGTIRTVNSEVVSGMTLFVKKGDATRTFASDINGEFRMMLQPGSYEVTVNKVISKDFRLYLNVLDHG